MQLEALAITTLAATVLPLGGAAAPRGASLIAQTDPVAYYAMGPSKIDVKKAERELDAAEKALGHRFQGRAEYYAYEDTPHLAAVTGKWLAGLTILSAGVISTTPEAQAHELVHLVSGQIGNPGHFFNEGLAVALTAKGKWQGRGCEV